VLRLMIIRVFASVTRLVSLKAMRNCVLEENGSVVAGNVGRGLNWVANGDGDGGVVEAW